MPIQIYTFSTLRSDLSSQQYKNYYENNHVPLILSLLGDVKPMAYVRNYITRSDTNGRAQLLMGDEGSDLDFDCVAESVFRDREHLQRFMEALGAPGKKEQREEDEKKFLDLSKLKAVMVETNGNYAD